MNQTFTAILQKLVAEQGKEALLSFAKCKSFLADYTRNEYKKESRLLLQAIDAEIVKAIDSTADIDLCKQQQVKTLQKEYFLVEEIARDLVDTLTFILRGDVSKTEAWDGAENGTIPKKQMYYISYNNHDSGPYEKSSIEAMIANGQITADYYVHSSQREPITALFTFPATAKAVDNNFSDPEGFVRVEGGIFLMGSNNGDDDEKPVHSVTVKSFSIGKYEVTQKEWITVMGNNAIHFRGDNQPIEAVSWDEVIEYCNKRSQKEGLTPAYRNSSGTIVCDFTANGYRLPTEAEWEFAAKGGNKALMDYTYSGSNNAGAVAWYRDNSGSSTHGVGTKAPNSLGIYDMSGNVCEWCWDWYRSYSSGAQTDPMGPSAGSDRVYRGGSWFSQVDYVRSASRNHAFPSTRSDALGFRLVRS